MSFFIKGGGTDPAFSSSPDSGNLLSPVVGALGESTMVLGKKVYRQFENMTR